MSASLAGQMVLAVQGFTPLQFAALRDQAGIVKFLLEKGANAVTRSRMV